MRKLLLILFLTLIPGCELLQAYKARMDVDPATGKTSAELKGAGPGGEFNENKGLNLRTGDNTIPALLVAVGGTALIYSAYPIQRALRRRRERKCLEEMARLQAAGFASSVSGLPSGLGSPSPNGLPKSG